LINLKEVITIKISLFLIKPNTIKAQAHENDNFLVSNHTHTGRIWPHKIMLLQLSTAIFQDYKYSLTG